MFNRKDYVTVELVNPRGWFYVRRFRFFEWFWEARLGGLGLDAGVCRTKRGALKAARQAVYRELGYHPMVKSD